MEIPRDVAPVARIARPASAPTQQARRRTSGADGRARPGRARARSARAAAATGRCWNGPDGRTEGDQAGRVRADVRHGVARSASHRHAPAGSRSGAAVSPSRSRLSSSSWSFPRRVARGAAAASFTPPSQRPRGWAAYAIPAVHHVKAILQTRREEWYTRRSRVVMGGDTPMVLPVAARRFCARSREPAAAAGTPAQRIDRRYARRFTRRSTPSLPRMLLR